MSPAVTAFFLGGTIGMAGHEGGVVTRFGAEELVAAVPRLAAEDVELAARNFRSMPSACLTFDDVLELVSAAGSSDADGIVVVQGTDTIEETSYLIDLVWPHDTTVVVTDAMRNPTMPVVLASRTGGRAGALEDLRLPARRPPCSTVA